MKKLAVLGPGCPKCNKLYADTERAATELGLEFEMEKITDIKATWLRVPIPETKQSVSDFGRNDSFNTTLVRVETDAGLVGHGEAKAECRTIDGSDNRFGHVSHYNNSIHDRSFAPRFVLLLCGCRIHVKWASSASEHGKIKACTEMLAGPG